MLLFSINFYYLLLFTLILPYFVVVMFVLILLYFSLFFNIFQCCLHFVMGPGCNLFSCFCFSSWFSSASRYRGDGFT